MGALSVQTNCRKENELIKILLLAGMVLVLAAPAYADWQQRAQDAVQVIPGSTPAPMPPVFNTASANDYCSYYVCDRPWWQLYGYGTGAHWDGNSPTMVDAPSWLTRRYTYKRRHR